MTLLRVAVATQCIWWPAVLTRKPFVGKNVRHPMLIPHPEDVKINGKNLGLHLAGSRPSVPVQRPTAGAVRPRPRNSPAYAVHGCGDVPKAGFHHRHHRSANRG